MKFKLSRTQWEAIGKKAGWASEEELGRRLKFVNKLMEELRQNFGGRLMGSTSYKYFEVSSEALGSMHVQVYYDKQNEALEFDKYYDNETLHDEYQQHYSVPMSFNDYDKMRKIAFSKVTELLG